MVEETWTLASRLGPNTLSFCLHICNGFVHYISLYVVGFACFKVLLNLQI